MTGLDLTNQIIEVAVAITDHHLSEIIGRISWWAVKKLMESMDVNTKQHKSQFVRKSNSKSNTLKGVESEVMAFLKQYAYQVFHRCAETVFVRTVSF